MRWLISRLDRTGRDRGASVVLVAVIATALLFGMGAFVVDVGAYYSQRAQTQNGADAAAVAIAATCAKGTCDLDAGDSYAPANSNDNLGTTSQVVHVAGVLPCGRDAEGVLPACPASLANSCPPDPGGDYVNVLVKNVEGVPAFFSAALGNGRKKIGSCAQAIWGVPRIGGDILALTIAECAWNTDTASGTNYAPSPPALPPASYEQALIIHNPDDPTDPSCVSGPDVGPLPGGFGWTMPDPTKGPCTTAFIPNSGGWYSSDPGQGTSTGTQCLDGGNTAGVIPCAQNPVVPNPPYAPGSLNACPSRPTPSPLIVPIYNRVCVQTGSTPTPSTDEVQTITITKATGGTFTLSFSNATGTATTGNLAYNISALALQSALEALPTIGAGNVSVTSPSAGVYTVTFRAALQYTDVNQLAATSNLRPATGGNKASITVTTTTQGNYAATTCPPGFSNGKYYHLLTLAAFVVTGYHGSAFPHDRSSWLTGRNWCVSQTGADKPCLLGYFVKATTDGEVDPGGVDTGVTVVKLNG